MPASGQLVSHIFISYFSNDEPVASEICQVLEPIRATVNFLLIASLPTVDLNNYGRSPVYNRLFSAVQLAYECDLLPSLVTFCSMTEQKKHNVSLPRISRTALSRVTDSESVYSLMLKFGLDQPTSIEW